MSPARPSAAAARADASASAPIFAALGDPTRLGMVARLCRDGPLSIARLSAGQAVTRQAITKHLRVLAQAGLVRGHRRGRESLWELEPRRLEIARRYLDAVSRRWDETLERLRSAVEREP
ncbi:MAG: ArsR/SmtB family transcription factor [Thermoanaerobaculia bacterium]